MKYLPLSECEWEVEIRELKLSNEINGQWFADCKTMNGIQYSNGGVGSISSVRIFETPQRAQEGWIEFAKVNGINKYKFIPTPNE